MVLKTLCFLMIQKGLLRSRKVLRELPRGRWQGESCLVMTECVCQHLTHHSVNTSDYRNSTYLILVLLSLRTLASVTLYSFDLSTQSFIMAGSSHTPVDGKSTNRRSLQQLLADLDEIIEMVSSIPSSPQQVTTTSPKLTRLLSLRPAIPNFLRRGKGTKQGAGSKSNEAVVQNRQVTELKPNIVPEIRPTPPEEHPHFPPGLEAHIPGSRPGSPQATVPSSPDSEDSSSSESDGSSSSESGKIPLLPPEYDAEFVEKAYFMFGVTTLAKKQHFDNLYRQARGLPVPDRGPPKITEYKFYRPSENNSEVCRHCFGHQQPSHTAAFSQGRQSGLGPNPPVISGPSTLYNTPLGGNNGMYQPYQGPLPRFGASQADNAHQVAEQLQHNVYAAPFPSPQRPGVPPYSAGIQFPPGYAPRPPYEATTRHFQSFPYAGPQQQQPPYQPQQQARMPRPRPPSSHPQPSRWVPQHHNSTHRVPLVVETGQSTGKQGQGTQSAPNPQALPFPPLQIPKTAFSSPMRPKGSDGENCWDDAEEELYIPKLFE